MPYCPAVFRFSSRYPVCIRLRAGGVFPGKGNNPARIAAQPTGSRTMTRTKFSPAAAVAAGLLFTLVGCEAKKSETPLSPSVAGPIPGVEISTPRLIEPSMGAKLKDAQQPIRLMIENSNTSGVRPLAYTFEVASDTNFSSKVFGRGSVPPGGDGKTSVQIDRLEIGRTYFWRVRAEDGANSGPFLTAQFEVLPKAFISAPTPTSPVNNEVVASRQPTLHVRNVDKNSAVGGLVYQFQVSSNQAFTSLTGNGASYEGAGETTVKVGADLPNNATQVLARPGHGRRDARRLERRAGLQDSQRRAGAGPDAYAYAKPGRWRQLRVEQRARDRGLHLGEVSRQACGGGVVGPACREHGVPARSDHRGGQMRRLEPRMEPEARRPGTQRRLPGVASR